MTSVTYPGPHTFPGASTFPGYSFPGVTIEERLLEGIAATLAEGNEHSIAWHPLDEPYAEDAVGIYRELMAAKPRAGIAITVYTLESKDEHELNAQFHFRAVDAGVLAVLVQDVYDLFEGRWGGMLGTVKLVLSARTSGTSIGQDANGRRGRYENYSFRIARDTPQRP